MYWKRIIMRGISDIYSLTGSIIGMPCGYRILMYHSVGGNVIRDKLNIFGHDRVGRSQTINRIAHHQIWRKPIIK